MTAILAGLCMMREKDDAGQEMAGRRIKVRKKTAAKRPGQSAWARRNRVACSLHVYDGIQSCGGGKRGESSVSDENAGKIVQLSC